MSPKAVHIASRDHDFEKNFEKFFQNGRCEGSTNFFKICTKNVPARGSRDTALREHFLENTYF